MLTGRFVNQCNVVKIAVAEKLLNFCTMTLLLLCKFSQSGINLGSPFYPTLMLTVNFSETSSCLNEGCCHITRWFTLCVHNHLKNDTWWWVISVCTHWSDMELHCKEDVKQSTQRRVSVWQVWVRSVLRWRQTKDVNQNGVSDALCGFSSQTALKSLLRLIDTQILAQLRTIRFSKLL